MEQAKKLGINSTLIGKTDLIKSMDGEPSYSGRTGKIEFIDDAGQFHGTWGGCALVPGVDEFAVVL